MGAPVRSGPLCAVTEINNEEFARLREFAKQQAADAASLRIDNARLKRDNKRLTRRLDRVYSSWTWRAGRLVLFPYHVTEWIIDKLRRRETGDPS